MLNAFFNSEIAEEVRKEYGEVKILLAANTLAHIPDINSVFDGINKLLAKDGVFVSESHYLVSLLEP